MFSLFKRKAPEVPIPAEKTFKTRVDQFWIWYTQVAERFYQKIEDGKCPDLAPEVSAKVNELIPGFAWVFGPGADKKGHSFTLSGEGNPHKQLLVMQWLAKAPQLPGWTFYAARQPSSEPGQGHLRIGDQDFHANAFWLTPAINEERELVDLTVWHPLFPQLDDRTRWTILFLFLDEALGEIGTQNWIGRVEMNDTRLAEAIPLAELPNFIERLHADKEWQKGAPGEFWTTYRLENQRPGEPRGDVFVGGTGIMALINEYHNGDGPLPNPLPDIGADYVYIAFDVGILPKGEEVNARGEIEDALEEALAQADSGRPLGGAMGSEQAYIDLLIFDGAASVAIIRKVLQQMELPAGTSINYFAHEKRGHRVVL